MIRKGAKTNKKCIKSISTYSYGLQLCYKHLSSLSLICETLYRPSETKALGNFPWGIATSQCIKTPRRKMYDLKGEDRKRFDVWIFCFVGREHSKIPYISTVLSLSHRHQEKNLKLLLICSKTYTGLILKSFQSILLQQTSHFRHESSAFSPPLQSHIWKGCHHLGILFSLPPLSAPMNL